MDSRKRLNMPMNNIKMLRKKIIKLGGIIRLEKKLINIGSDNLISQIARLRLSRRRFKLRKPSKKGQCCPRKIKRIRRRGCQKPSENWKNRREIGKPRLRKSTKISITTLKFQLCRNRQKTSREPSKIMIRKDPAWSHNCKIQW